jgi:predicted DNA-binding protein (MmcQ/YjbR family)
VTRDEFDDFCRSLKSVTHVVQWRHASVWKIGGKIFAIFPKWGKGDHAKISFKCSDLAYAMLCEQPNCIPAPYLARAKWVQIDAERAMTDQNIKDYIQAAYGIVMGKLTKAKRNELGLTLP